MSKNTKVILLRFVRSTAAVAVAGAAAWVAGPEALSIVPDRFDFLVVGVGAPALLAVEKWLRDGGDANA